VLLRVLRIRAATDGSDSVGWRLGGDLDATVVALVQQASAQAAASWAELDTATTAIRAGTGAAAALFSGVPGPPSQRGGANWLLDCARWGHVRTRLASVAAELGVFTALADGPMPATRLVDMLGVAANELAPILAALVRMTVLTEIEAGYQPAEEIRAMFAMRHGTEALVLGAELAHVYWQPLGRLEHVARTGELSLDLHDPQVSTRFYGGLARYNMLSFPGYFRVVRPVATVLASALSDSSAVLDVGAGSGVWGSAFAVTMPDSRVTFLDRAQVLAQAKENAKRLGFIDRAAFTPIDLSAQEFGDGTADVLTLGQVCHALPRSELPTLLARCGRALRPGGVLVLADLILGADHVGPNSYLHFAVKELVSTGGEILSYADYYELLRQAGFTEPKWFRFDGLDVMLATWGSRGELPVKVPGAVTMNAKVQ
jgi:ubiquinone/menaquinone biosynthesis C-methylase UbiE